MSQTPQGNSNMFGGTGNMSQQQQQQQQRSMNPQQGNNMNPQQQQQQMYQQRMQHQQMYNNQQGQPRQPPSSMGQNSPMSGPVRSPMPQPHSQGYQQQQQQMMRPQQQQQQQHQQPQTSQSGSIPTSASSNSNTNEVESSSGGGGNNSMNPGSNITSTAPSPAAPSPATSAAATPGGPHSVPGPGAPATPINQARSATPTNPPSVPSSQAPSTPNPSAGGTSSSSGGKEINAATVCKIGQETVQEIVSRIQEVFSYLKSLQPPVGAPNQDHATLEKQERLREVLKGITLLFKRLRVCWDKAQEQTSGIESSSLESLIPIKEADIINGSMRSELEKKRGETYRIAHDEHAEVAQQLTLKNRQMKEIIDQMRNIIWEINTMLAMRQ